MENSLIRQLVLRFGINIAFINHAPEQEVDLFVRALRGVSGVNLIFWDKYADQMAIYILGDTNRVERAMRELIPRFRLVISRVDKKRY